MPCRRPETEADGPFLLALFAACQETAFGQAPAFASLDPGLRTLLAQQGFAGQRATYRARYPDARFDLIVQDGARVGRIVTDRRADALALVDLAVVPERRGRGIGTAVIRAVLAEAGAAGLAVTLSVGRDNRDAIRLYERLGFRTVAAGAMDLTLAWSPSPEPR